MIDSKTAKHSCNVIRRQIQASYPDLYLNFTIHKENDRQKAFKSEENLITEHDAGIYIKNYMYNKKSRDILKQNKSSLTAIAHHNSPGFLGFFKSSSFFAHCFINYENFSNEDNLRNHALHIAWHAISLYRDFLQNNADNFIIEDNIITPKMTKEHLCHKNLKADIFSASLQTLQGRKTALDSITKQRINSTMSAETGFIAENFPFLISVDTLDYVFKNNIEQYNNSKKPVLDAVTITDDIGQTYENASIEQWRSFCIPAQKMAWLGYDIKSILTFATYSGENVFTQSIADMITERMHINPKEHASQQKDFNPFANIEKIETLHQNTCDEFINQILGQTNEDNIYIKLTKDIQRQNIGLLKGNPLGWCANSSLEAAKIIKQADENNPFTNIKAKVKKVFENEQHSIKWGDLSKFTDKIFEYRRNGEIININTISEIVKNHDEFSKIYQTLLETNNLQDIIDKETAAKKQNITDFISPNAIK